MRKRESRKPRRSGKATPVFCRHNRAAGEKIQRLSQRGARNIIDGLAKDAGIRERVTPHRYRHYAEFRIMPSNTVVARFPIGRGERAQVSYPA